MLSENVRAEILALARSFPVGRSAVIPALHLAQEEQGGWLPAEAIDEVAALLGLPATQVGAVASFYTLFNRQPVGRHRIYVCTNVSCSLLGAERIVEYLASRLGIRPGETTPDGLFSLFEAECLGSCGTAPMMQVDDRYYENLTEAAVDEILDALRRNGRRP
ncbi:MAG TPA: NADH-quinone oxidoreductase subunit NuoE [Anaerolineae bacterium]|nr:NADH-quinone oxidoreductase subunit NuoE [Anaerolineae bacterium]